MFVTCLLFSSSSLICFTWLVPFDVILWCQIHVYVWSLSVRSNMAAQNETFCKGKPVHLHESLALDLLPLKSSVSLAVPQLSGRLINLQVKCVHSTLHPPRSLLCWHSSGDAVWRGQENGPLKGVRGWYTRPASRRLLGAFHHRRHHSATYTVYPLHEYQWRRAEYSHSSLTTLTNQSVQLCH